MPIIMAAIVSKYLLKLHALTVGNKQSRKNPIGMNRTMFPITFVHHVANV